ncbi:MAG: response regulator [Cyclobacteriaceae bacterium]|nr:response regulator [Cyclobacteriaceae bacterium]
MSGSILIVEDEPIIASDIAATLKDRGFVIAGIVDNADDAMKFLSTTTPDLALLDVKIRGTKDGIALAHDIRARYKLPFIFLTSYYDAKTVDRAKAAEPEGYIVKPFDENDLFINVEMALYKNRSKPAAPVADKFFVKNNQEMIALEVSDIHYVEAFDNYAKVATDKEKYIVSHTLKSVEEKLITKGFVRVHRSYLVNFQKISSISEGYLFIGLTKIPLGQSYREELLSRITFL